MHSSSTDPVRISNEKRPCRLEGFCDDAKSPVREVPLKSAFDQVYLTSTASEPNLAKTSFELSLRRGGCCICGGERLAFAA